jgi:hypothetical protein
MITKIVYNIDIIIIDKIEKNKDQIIRSEFPNQGAAAP